MEVVPDSEHDEERVEPDSERDEERVATTTAEVAMARNEKVPLLRCTHERRSVRAVNVCSDVLRDLCYN